MSFISYAQNFEDVMLWRALKHVDRGFYIDVGANDPELDSVSKSFYDHGWRGINIEPVAQWFEKLEEIRSRDINLQLAAGAEAGEMVLYELPDTGLSTIDKSIAERHEAERGYVKNECVVPVKTLTEICKLYHESPIHFLKIDVEGAEKQVLLGLDLEKIRPWIIVVESTLPNTQIEDHGEWESILSDAGYDFVYFDGLNRFYVACEHPQLKFSFRAPPNVFDDFIRAQQLNSELRAQQAEAKSQQAETRAQQAEAQAQQAEAQAQQAEAQAQQAEAQAQQAEAQAQQAEARAQQAEAQAQQAEAQAQQAEAQAQQAEAQAQNFEIKAQQAEAHINAIYASYSWRLTAPLRWLGFQVIRLRQHGLFAWSKTLVKKAANPLVRRGIVFVSNRPRLCFQVITLAKKLGLYESLRTIYLRFSGQHHPMTSSGIVNQGFHSSETITQLTPRARRIYADLKAAIGNNNEAR